MPNWSEVLLEIQDLLHTGDHGALDVIRRKYLSALYNYTGRNVVAYYSGWLQKGNHASVTINDKDKNGLMVTVNKLNRSRGLDLILHTPGGDLQQQKVLLIICIQCLAVIYERSYRKFQCQPEQ